MSYDLRCQSDSLRVTKHTRVFGVSCCPTSESKVSLIMSDGRLLIWHLTIVDYVVSLIKLYMAYAKKEFGEKSLGLACCITNVYHLHNKQDGIKEYNFKI